MNVAEQIVAQLVDAGVHRIYGIVGDSLNPIVDAVRKTGGSKKGGIDWIHVRHEEAAAFAASAEAQLTGKLAVCAGSCGPGNLHLINGLYDANRTGAPVLAIASHIPSVQIGSTYFQETHPDRIFEECSVYNELISSAAQSPRTVNSAIRHAVGLGGVSVITLPGDVSDLKAVEHVPTYAPARPATLAPNPADIDEAAALLNKADKVAIFAGAGVEGAHDEVIALADALKAPIGHSLRGKHFIQYDNPFDVGMTGLLGYGAAAEGMNDADVLILLGTDFPYDQFLPDTPTIQVDTHAEKLGRRTDVGLAIHAQVKPFIEALLPHLRAGRSDSFLKSKIKKHSEIMHAPVGAYTRNVEKMRPIHPEYAAHLLNETAAKDAIFTADTGMCNVWTARYIDPLGTRRLIGSLLHGSMANALPMALGAQVAYPDRQVVSVSGDGGLSMLLGELISAKMYNAHQGGCLQQLDAGHGEAGDAGQRPPGLPDGCPGYELRRDRARNWLPRGACRRRVSPGGRVPRGLRCARPGPRRGHHGPERPLPPAGHHGRPGRRFCDRDEQDRPQPRHRRGFLDGDLQHAQHPAPVGPSPREALRGRGRS